MAADRGLTATVADELLTGGNASGMVVRVGGTLRKPWLESTPRVIGFMDALRVRGLDIPRSMGRDEQGRWAIEFVEGTMAIDMAPLPDELVRRVGALVRRIHDASEGLPLDGWPEPLLPAPHPDLLCHNDLATWNLVVDQDRLVPIDWDGAGPSSRSWDLAYAAIAFAHLFPDADPDASARRLGVLLDGYRAGDGLRACLPGLLAERSRAMAELLRSCAQTGREPWATMFHEGHGEHWLTTTAFLEQHRELWAAACR